ncbi:hypothetical protein [Desulfamplus magnetovallimortis]|nr:hypothetical protein [Desulfamplus magnetovallimortis]
MPLTHSPSAPSTHSDSGYSKSYFNINDYKGDPFRIMGSETSVNGIIFSTITFASMSHISFGQDKRTGVARICYYVRQSSNGGFDLCRSDTLDLNALNRFEEADKSQCDPVICKDIKEFKLRYRHIDGTDYDYWDSDSDEFDCTTPLSIHIVVAFQATANTNHESPFANTNHETSFNINSQQPLNDLKSNDHNSTVVIENRITMPVVRKNE